MTTTMLPATRQRRIVEMVSENDGCSVERLAEELDCSKATIRRDLRELADRQMIERSHGGAVPATAVGEEETYGQKEVQNLEAKRVIGERAIEEIQKNRVVFFDSGSTTMEVVKAVPDDMSFIAVTNSPLLALELKKGECEVKLTGGSLRRPTRALVGPSAEQFMDRMTFDLLFLGTNGIILEEGLMTPNEDEARIKELMIRKSERVVLVADRSNIGEQSFLRFGELADVDSFYTDGRLDDETLAVLEEVGIDVVYGKSG
jgi:DeoR family fructose operon transcriptional repressor